jgi:hypothetical protein
VAERDGVARMSGAATVATPAPAPAPV